MNNTSFYYNPKPIYTDIALAIGEPCWPWALDRSGQGGGSTNELFGCMFDEFDQFFEVYKRAIPEAGQA